MSSDRFYSNVTIASRLHALALERTRSLAAATNASANDNLTNINVMGVVILSMNALEAGINEVIAFLRSDFGGKLFLPECLLEAEIKMKWQDLPTLLKRPTFEKGPSPWQDFHNLVGLRNLIIHYKWLVEPGKFLHFLVSKKLILPPNTPSLGDAAPWTEALTNKVAEWSIETTSSMFERLTILLEKEKDPAWTWSDNFFPRLNPLP